CVRSQGHHSPAYEKFLASMEITYEKWHDGVGYDLEALRDFTGPERVSIVHLLDERLDSTPDWRDVEALAALGTPAARRAIRSVLDEGHIEIRMRAAEELAALGEPADLESVIIEALRTTNVGNGLSEAIDLAEQNRSQRIRETLLDLALNGNEDQ